MPKKSVKLTLQLPEGLAKEINDIVEKHDLWMSSQDFIREAIKEKMNSLLDQIAIFSRLKKISLRQYEKRDQLREMILDIQDVIRNLMEFRTLNQDNRFLEITIRDAARIQSRLVSKYTRLYGEFPFTVVEVEQ